MTHASTPVSTPTTVVESDSLFHINDASSIKNLFKFKMIR